MKTLEVLNYQESVASKIVIWRAMIIYIRISVNVNTVPDISRSTAVAVATGRSGDRNPLLAKDASLLQNLQTGSGASLASYSMGTGVLFRRPGRAVNHSLLNRTEVKNEWSYTSTLSIGFRGIGKGNFTFSSM